MDLACSGVKRNTDWLMGFGNILTVDLRGRGRSLARPLLFLPFFSYSTPTDIFIRLVTPKVFLVGFWPFSFKVSDGCTFKVLFRKPF